MGILNDLAKRFITTTPVTDQEAIAAYKEKAYSFEDEFKSSKLTKEQAMKSTAVYASVRLLSQAVASLPLHVKKDNDGTIENDKSHSVYSLLNVAPNNIQTPVEFKELMMSDLLLSGNFYAVIKKDKRMNPVALYRLPAESITILREGLDKVKYTYMPPVKQGQIAKPIVYSSDDMLHIKAHSLDGVIGVSPLFFGEDVVVTDLESKTYQVNFLKNGAHFSGYLQASSPLKAEQIQSIASAWSSTYGGTKKSNKTPVLPSNLEFKQRSLTPQQAQLIETNKFTVGDIARLFGVPPHLIGDLERSTNNNIEQQSREFLQYTLGPWLTKIEAEIARKLLKEREKKNTTVDFDTRNYLRATASDRAMYYNTLFNLGAITPNEIRVNEGMNPVENGDIPFVQVNLTTLDKALNPVEEQPTDSEVNQSNS